MIISTLSLVGISLITKPASSPIFEDKPSQAAKTDPAAANFS
ncbi:hypothetical protein ACOSZF_00110 [Cytobacillus firmus]|nr:hypothetical protein [Cytobacillus firmus]MEC1891882.1 hypothetical protein [Cytobacillus firmus]MED1939560.1 hypothetical protein [Cytobacillus firmus]MED4449010.1 hypothetical protein [Cytobacillus firmus]MED4767918.1 hypothetical protein [Cytobacillus firmus]